MYYNDHNPPHFHARYSGQEIQLTIDGLETLEGSLPRRALNLVLEWAAAHTAELVQDWELARQGVRLNPIDPLE